MTQSLRKVPVWLADQTNSGVFTVWMNFFFDLPLERFVFISDANDINPGLSRYFISSEEFLETHRDYTLPILNLGTSTYFAKQMDFLLKKGGYVWFHQLFLHKLVENYYLRGQIKNKGELISYGRKEADKRGMLLAELGELGGLTPQEYYLQSFAKIMASKSIGFCSSWSGAAELLMAEGLDVDDAKKFKIIPPVYNASERKWKAPSKSRDFERHPLRLGLLGHYNPMKNPEYCLEVVRELNNGGLPARLVAIGSVGEQLIRSVGLEDQALIESHQAPQHSRVLSLLAGLDANLHFRDPFGGEMSATITESVSQGVPTIGFSKDFLLDVPAHIQVGISPDHGPARAAARIIDAIGTPKKLSNLTNNVRDFMKSQTSLRDAVSAITEIADYLVDSHNSGVKPA